MTRAKSIVFTFTHARKSADSFVFSVGMKNLSTAGKYLMSIGLVTNIPDQGIVRGVVYIMKGNRKFNDTKAGPQVPRIG